MRWRVFFSAAAVLLASTISAATGDEWGAPSVVNAAESRDHETLRTLLSEGADVNSAAGDGMSALHWAAYQGDVEMAELLLFAGANSSATTRLVGFTPLLLAAKAGHASMIELLLGARADTEDRTSTGTTALMFAAASGSVDAVRFLLDAGADANATESTGGQSPLMFAAAHGRRDVIALLTSRGADVSAATEVIDAPALNQSLDEGFRERIEQLKKDREEAADAVGDTEEASVVEPEKKRSFFARLFGWMVPGRGVDEKAPERRQRESYGVRVGQQGGMTPLLLAARQGEEASVLALLEAGAAVNQVAAGSQTSALLIATMNGHFDLALKLVGLGADPNLAAEPNHVTPLYAAINLQWAPHAMYPQPTAHKQQEATHLDLMKALLEAGADPDARLTKKVWFMHYNFDTSGLDETGATPFWRAAYGSDVPAMALLRAYGADSDIRTQNAGRRAFVAEAGKKEKDPSGLPPVPPGGPSMTPLHAATGAGFGSGFAANDHRNHPAGFMPAVKYLVEECGVDVNARDHDGTTPLHNAASRGDVEMIDYLVSKGADVTLLNRRGQSTADMANGPVQRINPFPEARDRLVSLGAVNHDRCVSC